jgi:hypothetical protein
MRTPAFEASVEAAELPADALLQRLRAQGAFTDAYRVAVPTRTPLAGFVEAFYTTPLFRLERVLLRLAGAASSDADARALGEGQGERFAVWHVLARSESELLLAERSGRTCSWFRVDAPTAGAGTVLWFGSALVPRRTRPGGEPEFGRLFTALLGAHDRYSRALLAAAASRLLGAAQR